MNTKTTKTTKSAGGVVLNSQKQVLVVNQNHNSWSLPKGHIDPGETSLQAATREIWEESGIPQDAITLQRELGTYHRYKIALDGGDDPSEKKEITLFLFTTNHNELKPVDPQNPEARWVDKEDVAPLLTHKKDKEFFESIKESLQ